LARSFHPVRGCFPLALQLDFPHPHAPPSRTGKRGKVANSLRIDMTDLLPGMGPRWQRTSFPAHASPFRGGYGSEIQGSVQPRVAGARVQSAWPEMRISIPNIR
jgi:hypothetical protein